MSTETLAGKIESADELRDCVNVDAAIQATSDNGTTFEDEIRAQLQRGGFEATDKAITDLVAELDEETMGEQDIAD